ncbi:ankyrin repeat-containing protein [Fusarium circinatum]|uniref:Ankyrin repeat-containing protein n=1 Tax=Fusarium circinatum TaxID=48490 RepID=A0A8H5T2K9_FUSCI|nr:ankyrin repeat-containing protein [Fusarium circinatum]
MADPVGITGTAVGVISFGLQLYTGITQYLDAVKGRDEDLQRAKQYANAFQASLKVLGDTILKVNDQQAAAKNVIQDCKISCEAEITALGALLNDLKGPQHPQCDRISRIEGSLQKWSYPFKQRNLSRLEERLESANSVLKLSLLTLQLAILGNQEKAILDLQKSINVVQMTAGSISGATLHQSESLKLANDTLAKSHQEIMNVSQRVTASFDPRIDEILTHLRNLPNAQHQCAQLVAYQQDLKTLCDAVRNLSPHVATRMTDHGIQRANFKNVQSHGMNKACYCTRRRNRSRKEVR